MKKTAQRNNLRRGLLIGGPLVIVAAVLVWGSIPHGPLVITPPPADGDPQRWVHIEGAANTRDVGGYTTRAGHVVKHHMVYRSAKLHRLSDAGAETFRQLGIKTVIDFCNRLTPWPLFGGDGWSVHWAASVHGCPMSFAKTDPRDQFYITGVRENADQFRRAFELLANPDTYPVLYHCRAGTDRTGVMTALLLSLLGVDRDTVIADFRLSEKVNLPGNLPAMNALLDQVDAQGGIESYLATTVGISPETQQRIRQHLLTTP